MVKTKKEYALYKGDNFIAMGTIKEISEILNAIPVITTIIIIKTIAVKDA